MKVKILKDVKSYRNAEGIPTRPCKAGEELELAEAEAELLIRGRLAEAMTSEDEEYHDNGFSGDEEKDHAEVISTQPPIIDVEGSLSGQYSKVLPILRTILNEAKTENASLLVDDCGEPTGDYERGAHDQLKWFIERMTQAINALEKDAARRER